MVTASAVFNALELFYLFETSNSSPHFGVMTSNNLVNLDDEIPSSLESMPKHYRKHVGNAVSILFSVLDVEVETAVKSLSSALKHERMGVRLTAVIALGSCGLHSPEAVSMLASMLAPTEWRVGVRVAAAETLGGLGHHAASAAPALASELNDGNSQVREAAAEALVALQENAVSAIPNIQRMLQKGDWWVQVAACNTCAGLGQIAGSMIPDLQNILTTAERHSVKVAALKALSSVGQNDTSILPAETAMLKESHETKDMWTGTEYTQNSSPVKEDESNTPCLHNQKTYFHEKQTWPDVKNLTSQGNLPKKEAHPGQTWADVKKLDSEEASGNSSSTAAPSEEEYVLLPRTSETRVPVSS